MMNRGEGELSGILESMADKGLCVSFPKGGEKYYQAVPMKPGIMYFQFSRGKTTDRDRKIAVLVKAYQDAYEVEKGRIKLNFPRNRVITVDRTIAAGNTIHTYDQVSSYIEKLDPIAVATCYCRHEAALLGEDTHGVPMEVCMQFGEMAEFAVERLSGRFLTKAEAQEVLTQSEEAGLFHMSRNHIEDIVTICNCDRWHCSVMKMVLDQPNPALFFNSGFEPKVNADLCKACETCLERCPTSARTMGEDDVPQVDLTHCFGCAMCATGCPEEAISMETKPDFPTPPKNEEEFMAAMTANVS
jgi:Pyruvate/2-oxoacid:ferredoxin oxidoreductase delta subunit